jgi:hypothetical protein
MNEFAEEKKGSDSVLAVTKGRLSFAHKDKVTASLLFP